LQTASINNRERPEKMRKVVGYVLMTLDGVVEEPGEWLEYFDEDLRENMVEVINAQDAVLLGRMMYQEWAAYWPTATDEPLFARRSLS
jgi:dihydrofolate reductase